MEEQMRRDLSKQQETASRQYQTFDVVRVHAQAVSPEPVLEQDPHVISQEVDQKVKELGDRIIQATINQEKLQGGLFPMKFMGR
jgi:hypothetical protein